MAVEVHESPQVMRTPGTHEAAEEHRNVTGLLTRLGRDTVQLIRQETALARTEMNEKLNEAKKGAAALASSSVVMLSGLIITLFAVAFGLAVIWPAWLAFLVVGGGVLLIGAVMAAAGKKKLEPSHLQPHQTRETLREDREFIREQV